LAIHLPPAEIETGVVPEPGTLALLGLGLLAGIVSRHRRTA
jgi:hypothetical protein